MRSQRWPHCPCADWIALQGSAVEEAPREGGLVSARARLRWPTDKSAEAVCPGGRKRVRRTVCVQRGCNEEDQAPAGTIQSQCASSPLHASQCCGSRAYVRSSECSRPAFTSARRVILGGQRDEGRSWRARQACSAAASRRQPRRRWEPTEAPSLVAPFTIRHHPERERSRQGLVCG